MAGSYHFINSGNQQKLFTDGSIKYSKWGMGTGVSIFFHDAFAIDAEYDFISTTSASATLSSKNPVNIYSENIFRYGISVVPFKFLSENTMYYFGLKFGANYTSLEFNQSLTFYTLPSNKRFTGSGSYIIPEFGLIFEKNLYFALGCGYEEFNPKLEGAKEALDASTTCLYLKLGFKL